MSDYSALKIEGKRPKITPSQLVERERAKLDDFSLFITFFGSYSNKRKMNGLTPLNVIELLTIYEISVKGKYRITTSQLNIVNKLNKESHMYHIDKLMALNYVQQHNKRFNTTYTITDEGILFVRGLKERLRSIRSKLKAKIDYEYVLKT